MILITCPQCHGQMERPDAMRGLLVECPSCRCCFNARGGRVKVVSSAATEPPTPPAPVPQSPPMPPAVVPQSPPTPLLVLPYECQQCHGQIAAPTGLRRCTINCPLCDRRTSLYAVLHRCLHCDRLLESPSACQGRQTTCPNCEQELTIPEDCVFRPGDEVTDPTWFGFDCPHCAGLLETKRDLVGHLAVCPGCL